MEEIGIMLYGYDEKTAGLIHASMEELLSRSIVRISASGLEKSTVEQVLEGGTENRYEEREEKFLMFLGFSDDEIGRCLKGFPRGENMIRPIFCGLTENNYTWTVGYLVEHLLEEKRSWSSRERGEE